MDLVRQLIALLVLLASLSLAISLTVQDGYDAYQGQVVVDPVTGEMYIASTSEISYTPQYVDPRENEVIYDQSYYSSSDYPVTTSDYSVTGSNYPLTSNDYSHLVTQADIEAAHKEVTKKLLLFSLLSGPPKPRKDNGVQVYSGISENPTLDYVYEEPYSQQQGTNSDYSDEQQQSGGGGFGGGGGGRSYNGGNNRGNGGNRGGNGGGNRGNQQRNQNQRQSQRSQPPRFSTAVGRELPRKGKGKKKKLKDKISFRTKGFFIPGGTKVPGKFRSQKQCENACNRTPQCLAGDYNKATYDCYFHNEKSCDPPKAHPSTMHFSKIPCQSDLSIEGQRTVYVNFNMGVPHGVLFKKIQTVEECIKKCLNLGGGVARDTSGDHTISLGDVAQSPQMCFAVDFDFSKHQCFMTLQTFFWNEEHHMYESFCTDAHQRNHVIDEDLKFVHKESVVSYFFCPSDLAD